MEETLKDVLPVLINFGMRLAGALFALWVAFRFGHWLERRVTAALRDRSFDEALSIFFGNLARWLFVVAAVLACLGMFGVETTSFAAIIGAASLAVGLAFQGTLSNFAAGVMILTFRPFRIGDYVQLSDQEGFVAAIGLFVTSLDTLDNRRLLVPNSVVISANIENRTHHTLRRVDVGVGVSYSADLDETRKVLNQAAARVQGRNAEKGHEIFLKGLGASSVDWEVRVWADSHAYWDVWDSTIRETKLALDQAGLSIPFPQLDLHVIPNDTGKIGRIAVES